MHGIDLQEMAQFFTKVNFIPKYLNNFAL